jgi:hypothetical protein
MLNHERFGPIDTVEPIAKLAAKEHKDRKRHKISAFFVFFAFFCGNWEFCKQSRGTEVNRAQKALVSTQPPRGVKAKAPGVAERHE